MKNLTRFMSEPKLLLLSAIVIFFVVALWMFVMAKGKTEIRCVREGLSFSAKDPDAACCAFLNKIEDRTPSDDLASCVEKGMFGDSKVCAACGNGLCGPGENRCNCPQDCSR